MQDERNQDQITRKDARDCFVESLRDCFQILCLPLSQPSRRRTSLPTKRRTPSRR